MKVLSYMMYEALELLWKKKNFVPSVKPVQDINHMESHVSKLLDIANNCQHCIKG